MGLRLTMRLMIASCLFLLFTVSFNECASLWKIKRELNSILDDVKSLEEKIKDDVGRPSIQSDSNIAKRDAV